MAEIEVLDAKTARLRLREQIEYAIGQSHLQTAAAQELRDQMLAIIGDAAVPAGNGLRGVEAARVFRRPGLEFRVGVRDRSHPGGPILKFSQDEWREFVRGVKDGRYDVEAL